MCFLGKNKDRSGYAKIAGGKAMLANVSKCATIIASADIADADNGYADAEDADNGYADIVDADNRYIDIADADSRNA